MLEPLIVDGAAALSTPVFLESLYSARKSDYLRLKEAYEAAMTILPLTPDISARAVEVQTTLAHRSQHRTAQASDLLTAACAEVNNLTVLHYDKDYDAIAMVRRGRRHGGVLGGNALRRRESWRLPAALKPGRCGRGGRRVAHLESGGRSRRM